MFLMSNSLIDFFPRTDLANFAILQHKLPRLLYPSFSIVQNTIRKWPYHLFYGNNQIDPYRDRLSIKEDLNHDPIAIMTKNKSCKGSGHTSAHCAP